MERTYINGLTAGPNKVLLKGWVHEVRAQSKIVFIIVRDRTGLVQAVVKAENEAAFERARALTKESVIAVEGTVRAAKVSDKEATQKEVEVSVESLEVLSEAAPGLPIEVVSGKDNAELQTRLDWRWIDLRKPRNALIFRVWTTMEAAMREFFAERKLVQVYSPKLTATASEGGSEVFELEYFGRKACLAQSPQLYKQMAMAAGFEGIFEIGPAFRANRSHTIRHDTEFTMVDCELSFIESLEGLMRFEEEMLVHVMRRVKEQHGEEITRAFGVEVAVPAVPFPRVTMEEARAMVAAAGHTPAEDDLGSEGEKLVYAAIKAKYGHEFVFVTEYPVSARPFYHMHKESDVSKTNSYDLLWKGMEITTGAQREHRYEVLKRQIVEKGVDPESLGDYLNFFKYGCPPHAGFALSPTRLLMNLLELKNVREATFLPRDVERLTP